MKRLLLVALALLASSCHRSPTEPAGCPCGQVFYLPTQKCISGPDCPCGSAYDPYKGCVPLGSTQSQPPGAGLP
jgi:hypothetical protein